MKFPDKNIKKKIFLFALLLGAVFFATNVKAANVGDVTNFNVDKSFDVFGRTQLQATLVKISGNAYFYVEKSWWDAESSDKQGNIMTSLNSLSGEFDANIYPTLTSLYGTEWKPGIDGDNRITVLFESMNSNEGGYFREADEYDKLQDTTSNQREMVYISLDKINDPMVKVILGHEFTHLITFNQKNKIFGVEEDTWLNEARADYSSTVLGYDDKFDGSNLQQRVNDFIGNPSDSLTDWSGTKYDYASASLFTHYLVDQYGINILSDSLKSKYVGIDSINYALQKNGYKDDFAQVFTNWTIASLMNDCSLGPKYCYLNKNLKDFHLAPTINFLPLTGDISLSVNSSIKNWSGNWIKFIGGNGILKLDFSGPENLTLKVPYVVEDNSNNYSVKFLTLDSAQKGEINLQNFGTDYESLVVMPILESDVASIDGIDPTYPFSYTVTVTEIQAGQDPVLIQKLLAQIQDLKNQIAVILARNPSTSSGQVTQNNACSQITGNLSFGTSGNQVSCLQQFLKNQGTDIYPEGFVTGFFGSLTKAAVIKFQGKYSIAQTGFVGILTRGKINQILSGG